MSTALIFVTFLAFLFGQQGWSSECKSLFKTSPSFYEAIGNIQKIVQFKIFVVSNKETELLFVFDKNRSLKYPLVFNQWYPGEINISNNSPLKNNFSPKQKDTIIESLKVITDESTLAIIDPYYVSADIKTSSQFGIFDLIKREHIFAVELSPQIYLKYKRDIENKREVIKSIASQNTFLGAAGAALAYVILDPPSAVIGVSFAVGFMTYNLMSLDQKIKSIYSITQIRAIHDILRSPYAETNRMVIILPDYMEKEFYEMLRVGKIEVRFYDEAEL